MSQRGGRVLESAVTDISGMYHIRVAARTIPSYLLNIKHIYVHHRIQYDIIQMK